MSSFLSLRMKRNLTIKNISNSQVFLLPPCNLLKTKGIFYPITGTINKLCHVIKSLHALDHHTPTACGSSSSLRTFKYTVALQFSYI